MAITLKDVAKAANIDIGSVSCTLRNHPKAMELRPETRERIQAVATELGYRPNALAASIRTGKNATIALIHDFNRHQTDQVLFEILQAATCFGFGVKLYCADNQNYCFDEILSNQIRYVISTCLNAQIRRETAEFCKKNERRLVFIYEQPCGGFPTINSDNFGSTRNAVRDLCEHGHTRIAMLCGKHGTSISTEERHEGFLQGLKECGLTPAEQLIYCDNDTENGILPMLHLPPEKRPTAFFCLDPRVAILTIKQIYREGFRVPEDFMVISYGALNFQKELLLINLADQKSNSAQLRLPHLEEPLSEISHAAVRLVLGKNCPFKPSPEGCYRIPCVIKDVL